MTRYRHPSSRMVWSRDPEPRSFETECCWPGCKATAGVDQIPLCRHHLTKAWRTFEDVYLWPLREAANIEALERITQRDEAGLVYFLRFGDRVKIGFTTNLRRRLADLPHDEVLGTVPGSMADEKRCHAAFAHLRETGEWFRAEPDLLAFIEDVAR